MLSLAKQHLSQHAQLAASAQAQSARSRPKSKPARADLLSGFPLAALSTKKSKKTPAAAAKSAAFDAQSQRRAARVISASALKRSKALQKKMPRPTLLEQAERSLSSQSAADRAEQERKNLRMLTHTSDRKKKTQEAMKQILLATTLPSRHAKPDESEEDDDDERDDFDDEEIADLMD